MMLFEMVKNNYKKLIALVLLFAAINLFITFIFLFLAQEFISEMVQFLTILFFIIHVFVRTTVVKSIYMMYSKTTTNINQLLLTTLKVIGGYVLYIISAIVLYGIFSFLPLLIPFVALMLALSFITMVIAHYRIIADEPFLSSFMPKGNVLFIYIYFFFSEFIYNGISIFLLGNQEAATNPILIILLSAFTLLKIVSDYYVLLSK